MLPCRYCIDHIDRKSFHFSVPIKIPLTDLFIYKTDKNEWEREMIRDPILKRIQPANKKVSKTVSYVLIIMKKKKSKAKFE